MFHSTLRLAAALMVATTALTACNRQPSPPHDPTYDATAARNAMVSALDAWKQGRARALTQAAPPIRFVDDDLAQGWLLVDYRLNEPDAILRPFQDVRVTLLLRDKRGETAERVAAYQVATSPALAVLRSDQ